MDTLVAERMHQATYAANGDVCELEKTDGNVLGEEASYQRSTRLLKASTLGGKPADSFEDLPDVENLTYGQEEWSGMPDVNVHGEEASYQRSTRLLKASTLGGKPADSFEDLDLEDLPYVKNVPYGQEECSGMSDVNVHGEEASYQRSTRLLKASTLGGKPADSFEDLDLADLPYVENLPYGQAEWSGMPDVNEADCNNVEAEKACSDRQGPLSTMKPFFSKVFLLASSKRGSFVVISKAYKPGIGSPSKDLQARPTLLEHVINATLRIKVNRKDQQGNELVSFGTGFAASPNLVLTAAHMVNKSEVLQILTHGGISVTDTVFDTDQCLVGADPKSTNGICSRARDKNGLFLRGADVACFRTQGELENFLLPCSPTFFPGDSIAMLSYPSVDRFLSQARKELVQAPTNASPIWKQYLPAVMVVYENTLKEHAEARGIRVAKARTMDDIIQAVEHEVKAKLYTELFSTFGAAHTGNMTCSVGIILCANKVALGTSCSTLAGSSGAAVIPLASPQNFTGIQRGGCRGYDMNSTTSADNKEFVEFYVAQVLDTLPSPHSMYWSKRDTQGFEHWLDLHKAHISKLSAWTGVLAGEKCNFNRKKRRALLA